jgi:cytoskeletal protein CcmA (bactofilin family)
MAREARLFNRSTEKMETVIGPGVVLKGNLIAKSGVRLDGLVEGSVETTGNVIVGEKGVVNANIVAQNVFVSGLVKGNVSARGRLEISAKGKLWGEMNAASFAVEEGGVFRGQSTMKHEAFGQEPQAVAEEQPAT